MSRPPAAARPVRRWAHLGLALVLLVGASLSLAHATVDDYPKGSQIHWADFQPALFKRARTENRPLFLYFHGQWCTWCRDFQEQSLEHSGVFPILQRSFIPVLVDLDRRRDLFTRYGGRGLPFVVILDEHETARTRFTGHVGPDDLARILQEQHRQVSVTGREFGPSDEAIDNVESFLNMLDEVYDPATMRLSGSALFGTLSKRPQPWTLLFLLQQDEWQQRIPGLLDQVAQDLADPDHGGFFFFHDPDQEDFALARETSKRLDQNAAFLWLFSEAYDRLDRAEYRAIARRSLAYLREHLWDAEQKRFYGSQYSDRSYYALPPTARMQREPPPVDRTTYADASGQTIAALVQAASALDDPSLLDWAREALEGLDAHLRDERGYFHAFPEAGPPELEGYLPAQVWPGIAWRLYHEATGEREREREADLLEVVSAHHDPGLNGYRERQTVQIAPWVETRTQAALAWWLARLSEAEREAAGIDESLVHRHLNIRPGDDPDDVVLGFWAQGRN